MPHFNGIIVLALLLLALNGAAHILTIVNVRAPFRDHIRVHQLYALIILLSQLVFVLFKFSATL